MAIYVWGLVGIVVFYIAMLGVGIWAGTKQKDQSEEEVMLAGRNLGTVVGFLTLIGASVCCSLIFLLTSVSLFT
jgi:high affinity choline transporter 7